MDRVRNTSKKQDEDIWLCKKTVVFYMEKKLSGPLRATMISKSISLKYTKRIAIITSANSPEIKLKTAVFP